MSDKNLYQRIVAIMDDMGAVGKTGKTAYGEKFPYHKIDDVDDALRQALVAHGVVATIIEINDRRLEHFEETTRDGKPRTTWYAECAVVIEIVNADKPEERTTIRSWGQGIDYSDKATGKAISYAAKAAYLSAFHLRGQPDNEADNIGRRKAKKGPPVSAENIQELADAINQAPDIDGLAELIRGSGYQQLKRNGPDEEYHRLSKLAEAKHAMLKAEAEAAKGTE